MAHQDFVIKIDRDGKGYRARVLASPAGEGSERFVPPVAAGDLAAVRRSLEAAIRDLVPVAAAGESGAQQKLARNLGTALYEALFQGPVKELFDRSLGRADAGLRIKLRFDLLFAESAWLANLPWELLHPPGKATYLGLNPATPIVRHLEGEAPGVIEPFTTPLRVLVAAANPLGTTGLDLEAEWREIERSAGASKMRMTLLPGATLGALVERLQSESFHILHFMGHGSWDAVARQAVLLFASAGGRPKPVSGVILANRLQGHRSLRLAVLNACHSGEQGPTMPHEPFAGVASTLVQAGLPAAVAMRSSISDLGAIAFSKRFYAGLAQGDPLDLAVTHGRQAIAPDCTASLEWSVPMLFLRPGDARLFAATPEPQAAGAAGPEPQPPVVPALPSQGPGPQVTNIIGSIKTNGDVIFGINQK